MQDIIDSEVFIKITRFLQRKAAEYPELNLG